MAFGLSFLPGGDANDGADPGVAQPERIQEAIRLLSLRLPRVLGAHPIAPRGLLQAPPQGPGMNTAMMLQALMAMAGMGGPPGGLPMGGGGAPRIGIGQELPPGVVRPPGPPNLPPPGVPIPPPNPPPFGIASPPGPGNRPPTPRFGTASPPGPGNRPPMGPRDGRFGFATSSPRGGGNLPPVRRLPLPRIRPITPPGPGNLPPMGPDDGRIRRVSSPRYGTRA